MLKRTYVSTICRMSVAGLWIVLFIASVLLAQAQEITIDNENIQIVAWQPIENGLLAFGGRQSEKVWIYDAGLEPVTTLTMEENFYTYMMRWSPDGARLAVNAVRGGRSKIFIWQQDHSGAFTLLTVIDLTNRASELPMAWSMDSVRLALIAFLRVEVWDTTTGKLIQRLDTPTGVENTGNATDIAWSPDDSKIAISTNGYYVHIVDTNSYQLLASIIANDEFNIHGVAWKPDGTQIAAIVDSTIKVFDANTYDHIVSVDNNGFSIGVIAWQGDYLAVSDTQPGITVWDTARWAIRRRVIAGDLAVISISWKPNSTILAYSGYKLGKITLLDVSAPVPTDLLAKVAECISDPGIQTSLTARIEAGQWQAIINEVEALESTKITAECAAEIVEMAGYFIENPPPE